MPPSTYAAGILGATILSITALHPAQAQQQESASGSVAGTVYIVSQNGERSTGRERTIYLLRDSDALRASLAEVCRSHLQQNNVTEDSLEQVRKEVGDTTQAPTEDPWTTYWAHETEIRTAKRTAKGLRATGSRNRIRHILSMAAVDSMGTGEDARYRFAGLHAGRYILFGEWSSHPVAYQWWLPVTLPEGAALSRDATSSAERFDQLPCGYR